MIERSSGIIMPVFSLPSPWGIGTLGKAAYDFADLLRHSGQTFWQMLPLGPTSYGDSPYQSFSSHAGNPYLIDLDVLTEDGLLTREEIAAHNWGSDPRHVDYGALYENRFEVLALAKARGWERDREAVRAFEAANHTWLPDYALYMALKRRYGMRPWTEWEDEALRRHEWWALDPAREQLREDVELFIYIQFLFFRQWDALKAYVNSIGLRIIGDLPIYVALDSADVWAERHWFALDGEGRPTEVAGVPPDYFSEDGQLWGNPLYDYGAQARDGYGWWIRRIGSAARMFDVIRIDHFRGFAGYWAVPAEEETARNGRWVPGPGMDLFGRLTGWFRDVDFIAEDLGFPAEDVKALLRDSGLPGMRVLEFAFDPEDRERAYQPHNYPVNCVCYTGTHDNYPLLPWMDDALPEELDSMAKYFGLNHEEGYIRGILRGGMGSTAKLFVSQLQDWLGLGEDSRINTPGTLGGNWTWRVLPEELTEGLSDTIFELTDRYDRAPYPLEGRTKLPEDEPEADA